MLDKKEVLQQKRYLAVVPILFLLFLICSFIFVFYMMNQNQKEKIEYLNNAAVQNQTTVLKQIKGDFQTLEGISVCLGSSTVEPEQLLAILRTINNNNEFIRMGYAKPDGSLSLVDTQGNTFTKFNLKEQEFFQKALLGELTISSTIDDSLSPGRQINYYAVPVKNTQGEIQGVLCAVNSTDMLRNILDVPLLNGSGYSDILNRHNEFIVCSKRSAQDNIPTQYAVAFQKLKPTERQKVEDALRRGTSVNFTLDTLQGGQQAVLVPIGVNGWFVLNLISQSVLRAWYNQTALGTMVIVFAACCIFMYLFYQQRRIAAKNQAELRHLAYDDPLTGYRNYTKFLQDAQALVNKAGVDTIAVWYCDLKRFKYFNDIYGYERGDEVLHWFASFFDKNLGPDGLFCRMSADNFVGLRFYREPGQLQSWFNSLLRSLGSEENARDDHIHIDLCMGVYCPKAEDSALSVNDMVNRANIAQKSIKQLPGNGFAFFTQDLREQSLRETQLENEGGQALHSREFVLYFQPKVGIQNDNRVAGAEVLVRWAHPQRGLLAPGVFIPLFEMNGMIVQLDRYIFREACAWLRTYLDGGGKRFNLAVNVSRLGLLREDFVEYYTRVKQEFAIADGLLELEFTEGVVLEDNALFLRTVMKLQQQGFICSLDDFGSGYSSLNVLKNLPINVLKLDILFFHKSVDITRERIVISNVIHMAKELNIRTIAEGVETPETVEYLRDAGCDVVQGYVFSRPLPRDSFDRLLRRLNGGAMPMDE